MAESVPGLKQELKWWQILMIAISGVIGVTIFSGDGEALEVSGPAGTLLAFAVIGIIAICVMEGISEMVQLFPAPNALVEYVRAFVDPDLAWVVGIAYWYLWASTFAIQIIAASSFTSYWGLAQVWQTLAFYVLAPIIIMIINFAGVKWYGLVETFGGVLKTIMVFSVAVAMYALASQENDGTRYIEEGFTNDPVYAKNHQTAACYVLPIIAYGFLGPDIVAVTAFEAQDLRSLRTPSKMIAYFVFVLYFFCVLSELLNVQWTNSSLPQIYRGGTNGATTPGFAAPRSSAIIIIAALQAGHEKLSGFLTGCMIFSALSNSNTALYVSSRTLYGLTREITSTTWPASWFSVLGTVVRKTGVPAWALLVSAISFFWLPFLGLDRNYGIQHLIEIMSTTAGVSGLLVWACQCIAFIRYHKWLRKHQAELTNRYARFNRWDSAVSSTVLDWAQPVVAWLGLIGCLAVVFIFTTATWWTGPVTFYEVGVAYASPVILLLLFLILKAFTRRPWVKLDDDSAKLFETLNHLAWLKPEQESRVQEVSQSSAIPSTIKGFTQPVAHNQDLEPGIWSVDRSSSSGADVAPSDHIAASSEIQFVPSRT